MHKQINLNPQRQSVGDCVIRVISAATGKEWEDVYIGVAVKGKDAASCWKVMDELMSTLAVVNERVYNRVMQKINEL